MDVRLSPEQRALRDSAAQLVERLHARSVRDLADRQRALKLDAAIAATGWREMRAAERDGSPGASGVEVAIVAEELAFGVVDAAFVGPTLAAELRRLAGAPAATEPETVAVAGSLATPAVVDPEGAVAVDAVAVDAAGANAALVLVRDGAGCRPASVALPQGAGAGAGIDLTRPTLPLQAAARAVPVDGQQRDLREDDLRRWKALGLALACADLVGVMRGAIRLAGGYAATRKQYGAPVGSFQAVQHLLADAQVAMEGSRSIARHAAWAVDALAPGEALAAAALAKAYCARAARSVCETAIQVHGGIGNTWEAMPHVFLRRALLSADLLGGVGESLDRVLEHYGIGIESGSGRGLR